jgi:hypothetical protein
VHDGQVRDNLVGPRQRIGGGPCCCCELVPHLITHPARLRESGPVADLEQFCYPGGVPIHVRFEATA